MLGSLNEAEDAAQEVWLRLSRSDTSGVENLGGWLTTVVARVCLDMLRWRKSRREESLDLDAPEPVVGREHGVDPEHEAVLALRRDRSHRRALTDRGTAGRGHGSRRRAHPSTTGRRRVPRSLARR